MAAFTNPLVPAGWFGNGAAEPGASCSSATSSMCCMLMCGMCMDFFFPGHFYQVLREFFQFSDLVCVFFLAFLFFTFTGI